jgi:adenosylcobinamide-GDP ribazoletransferase
VPRRHGDVRRSRRARSGLIDLLRTDLVSAFMLLTRLPAGWLATSAGPGRLADAVWAFPVVGAVVGAIGGGVFWVCARLAMPPGVATVWTLASMLLVTGALHEDGLADFVDGLGGGRTRERKLAIMRDSRIGTFGALALMLSLAARGTALAALAQPARVAVALIVAAALGRGAIAVLLLTSAPARPDGLAAQLQASRFGRTALGPGIAVVPAFALLPFGTALGATTAALVSALVIAWFAHRQLGGYTGDVLGAAVVVTECVVLAFIR